MIYLSTAPVLLKTVRRGIHRGKAWADVPTDYMKWVLSVKDPPFDADVVHTCKFHVAERKAKRAAVP